MGLTSGTLKHQEEKAIRENAPDGMCLARTEFRYDMLNVNEFTMCRYPLTVNCVGLRHVGESMARALRYLSEAYDMDPVIVYTGTSGVAISSAIVAAIERSGVRPSELVRQNALGLIHVKSRSNSAMHRAPIERSRSVSKMSKSDRSMLVFVDDMIATGQTYTRTLETITQGNRSRFCHRDAFDVVMVPGTRARRYVEREDRRPTRCVVTGYPK